MDGYPENKAANSRIEQYASLLRIRKKWSLIYTVVAGICSVVSLAAVIGLTWAFRDRAITFTTMLVVIVCIFPYIGLVNQVAEHRRLNGVLELLDVLERAAGKGTSENQDS
jgi:hypothetical protein